MTSIKSGSRIWLTTGNNHKYTMNSGREDMWTSVKQSEYLYLKLGIVRMASYWKYQKKAELPFPKAARLSVETRGFPSLSCDKFGFILYQINWISYITLYQKRDLGSIAQRGTSGNNLTRYPGKQRYSPVRITKYTGQRNMFFGRVKCR